MFKVALASENGNEDRGNFIDRLRVPPHHGVSNRLTCSQSGRSIDFLFQSIPGMGHISPIFEGRIAHQGLSKVLDM